MTPVSPARERIIQRYQRRNRRLRAALVVVVLLGLTAQVPLPGQERVRADTQKPETKSIFSRFSEPSQPARITRLPGDIASARMTNAVIAKTGSPDNPRVMAASQMAAYGWDLRQYECLNKLWIRESGWNHLAVNRSSGAYGIPQSLPATKMAAAGPDWRTNPSTQIAWGLSYIKARYGTPCSAWAHSEWRGWY